MEGAKLPTTTVFRPKLGKALSEAYAKLAAPALSRRQGGLTEPSKTTGKMTPILRHAEPATGSLTE